MGEYLANIFNPYPTVWLLFYIRWWFYCCFLFLYLCVVYWLCDKVIIPTQCFYRFFGDFDWSVGKIELLLHFDKSPCVGIFDNCLDITVVDCVNNNEL